MKKYRYLGLAVLGVFCILVIYLLLASHQRGENPETFQWVHLQSVNRFYFTEYEKDTATVFCLKDWARIEEIIKLCEESTKTGEDSVSELPNKDFLIMMEINERGGARRTLYYEEEKEMFDMPYEKKYRMKEGSIDKIRRIYRTYGDKCRD